MVYDYGIIEEFLEIHVKDVKAFMRDGRNYYEVRKANSKLYTCILVATYMDRHNITLDKLKDIVNEKRKKAKKASRKRRVRSTNKRK